MHTGWGNEVGFPNPFDESIGEDVPIDSCAICNRPVMRKLLEKGYDGDGIHISPLYDLRITCEPGHSFISSTGRGERRTES